MRAKSLIFSFLLGFVPRFISGELEMRKQQDYEHKLKALLNENAFDEMTDSQKCKLFNRLRKQVDFFSKSPQEQVQIISEMLDEPSLITSQDLFPISEEVLRVIENIEEDPYPNEQERHFHNAFVASVKQELYTMVKQEIELPCNPPSGSIVHPFFLIVIGVFVGTFLRKK